MKMTLYPPLIEAKLKAFASNADGSGKLEIPFQHNPAINQEACQYMVCRICTLAGTDISDGKLLYGTIDKQTQSKAIFTWEAYNETNKVETTRGNQLPNMFVELDEPIDDIVVTPGESINPTGMLDTKYSSNLLDSFPPKEEGVVELSPSSWGIKDSIYSTRGSIATENEKDNNDSKIVVPSPIVNAEVMKRLTELGTGYYRIQIAYYEPYDKVRINPIDSFSEEAGRIGYYSDVAIIRYTTLPKVQIVDLKEDKINVMNNRYNGLITFTDINDYVYSYRYIIYTDKYNLEIKDYYLEHDTGEILYNNKYNSAANGKVCCMTSFSYDKDLPKNQKYYVELIVNTINGLTVRSPRYTIKGGYAINLKLPKSTCLIADVDEDNAYATIKLQTDDEEGYYSGKFEILRTDNYSNFKKWDKIYSFELCGEKLTPDINQVTDKRTRTICNDFTVEQGVRYQYALRQYNDFGVISNKLKSEIIAIDYEHMYLSDSEHLLCIKFNPTMSTFKPDILESKLETIGSKYPYIFRNGIVNYKEFAISGLISYLMDSANKFIPYNDSIYSIWDTSNRRATPGESNGNNFFLTDLTGVNILYEKEFKLKVLDWLTNGKPKLLRSPTEGAYIVRLMNVSLSPQQNLGRMLHTFNSTAYEIDELNMNNLIKYNLIKTHRTERSALPEMLFRGYEFNNRAIDAPIMETQIINDGKAYKVPTQEECINIMKNNAVSINGYITRIPQLLYKVAFYDCIPGSIIGLQFKSLDPESEEKTYYHAFMIGKTGTYEVQINDPIMGIYLLWLPPVIGLDHTYKTRAQSKCYNNYFKGKISYGYADYFIDKTFDLIKSVQLSEEIIQITGLPINSDSNKKSQFFTINELPDIFEFYQMNNLVCNLSYIHSLKLSCREIVDCYWVRGGNDGIYAQAHLPYEFEDGDWVLRQREEYFLCRTAFRYQDNTPAHNWHVDGKVPLHVSEIEPQVVYKCHILLTNGEFRVVYLDGRLLRLTIHAIHPTSFVKWDFTNYNNFDLGKEHWTAYDIFSIPNEEWLNKCIIADSDTMTEEEERDLFRITLSVNGNSDSIYFTPSWYDKREEIFRIDKEGEPCIYPEQKAKTYRKLVIDEKTNTIILRNQEIANGFGLVVGPMIQIDGVLTMAQLEYDLQPIANMSEEQITTYIINLSQTLQEDNNSLSSSWKRYQLHKAMEQYIYILSYYIASLGIANQPLMIPPLDWLTALDNSAGVPWQRIDNQIGMPIWNDNLIKPLPIDVDPTQLPPGIYYSDEIINQNTPVTDDNIVVEIADNGLTKKCTKYGSLVIIPPSNTFVNIYTQNDLYADGMQNGRVKNCQDERLNKAKILPVDTNEGYEFNQMYTTAEEVYTDEINNDQLKQLLLENNIVSIPANTVIDIGIADDNLHQIQYLPFSVTTEYELKEEMT